MSDELADLPAEVRTLVHAVDRMRERWAEADHQAKTDLWRAVHTACDDVWGRASAPVDVPARFRAAAEAADGVHARMALHMLAVDLERAPAGVVEAIGRVLRGAAS